MKSKSENYLAAKGVPSVTPTMYKGVSDYRKGTLEQEMKQGLFKDGSGISSGSAYETTSASFVTSAVGHKKTAQVLTGASGASGNSGWRGPGGTVRQTPEVYSPLWLNSNLNLPRDRATINAWCRSFFALNPVVQNAINLHSTYPISKLNIKCANKKIEKFFNEMIEEIDLMNICVQVAQEYWLLGESFVYAELDESIGRWSRLVIQNPDYITVRKSAIASEPLISLRPDENLRQIVKGNKPADIAQRDAMNPSIIEHIRKGENIPLDNFYVSHLARKISPYEVRGTGLPISSFRQLMLFDSLRESKFAQAANLINPLTLVKIGSADYKPTFADLEAWREVFECHDEETEVLTDDGFKKFHDVIVYDEDENKNISNIRPKEGIKIACFNSSNEQLEYHEPKKASLYNYSGDMYHYKNEKIDIKVTPNHKMWVSQKEYEYNGHRDKRRHKFGEWKKIEAKDLSLNDYSKFRSSVNWEGNDDIKHVNVCGKNVPIELYLEFLGYLISEGCIYTNKKYQYTVTISQTFKKYQKEMLSCVQTLSSCIDRNYFDSIDDRKNGRSIAWQGGFSGKEIFNHFKSEVQDTDGNCKSYNKQIPKWIKQLSPRLLNILLKALVMGDGSVVNNPNNESTRMLYHTSSKQLCDDVYEIVYKCGFSPITITQHDKRNNHRPMYSVLWSTSGKGNFPLVYKTNRNSQTKEKKSLLNIEKYKGKVWCFEVPTGLFITRRNGRITIQGNSAEYDKDFKIFTHEGVTVERVGAQGGIIDISGDITQLLKEIYIGLMIPSVLMDGGDITYANGGISLDVLRQRYMSFRTMMTTWLKRKIFQPIAKINEFYEYVDGEKTLIVPDIDWNHMSLFDASDYVNTLVQLTTGEQKKVPIQTLYRSLGLEYEDEMRKLRKEDIADAIRKKEQLSLEKMPLNELRSLNDDDEIPEITESPEASDSPYDGEGQTEESAGSGGGGGGLLGALPGISSPPAPTAAPTPPAPETPPAT